MSRSAAWLQNVSVKLAAELMAQMLVLVVTALEWGPLCRHLLFVVPRRKRAVEAFLTN